MDHYLGGGALHFEKKDRAAERVCKNIYNNINKCP
jgi:hypothetical protein